MNSSNSLRVLIFVASVIGFLALLALIVPDEGVKIGDFKLKFLPSTEMLSSKKQTKKDISSIVEKVNTKEEKVVFKPNKETSNHKQPAEVVNYEKKSSTNIFLSKKAKLELNSFFEKITSVSANKEKIHILHFGDSQIEGDRMTGFIRQRIQEKFGGKGPGLVPANNVYSTYAFRQEFSENFVRYTCFGGPKLPNRQYGVLNSAARFTSELDTNRVEQEAWIAISPSGAAHSTARSYDQVKMFYNSCTVPCRLTVIQSGRVIHEENLITDAAAHTVNIKVSGTKAGLKFVFRSTLSPNIVGFSCEGDYGVQVDNIAMRGSSGTFFGTINNNSFSNMIKELNTELTIMQFGGNTLPYLKDSVDVRKHAKFFQGQLLRLKKLNPEMAVIMIGPSDMSKLKDGVYATYPLLPYWVAQLKKAANTAGVGYWDLYAAMGGENSMPSWVEKDLGRSDHVHFSVKGATIAAQLFYEALMSEYLKFKEK